MRIKQQPFSLIAAIMRPITVEVVPDSSIETLGRIFREFRVTLVPVVDRAKHLVGIVMLGDLVASEAETDSCAESEPMPFGFHVETAPLLVRDIMKPVAFIVHNSTPIRRAARLMVAEKLLHLPVVDSAGRLVGLVSALDVLQQVEPRLAAAIR